MHVQGPPPQQQQQQQQQQQKQQQRVGQGLSSTTVQGSPAKKAKPAPHASTASVNLMQSLFVRPKVIERVKENTPV
jgi:transcription initiation factor TFIID subunit TAF12